MESTQEKEKTPAEIFLTELRNATDPMHKGLEANSISKKLMSREINLSDYGFYLGCMAKVILRFDERILPAVSSVITDFEERKKSKDIAQDLEFLRGKGVVWGETKPFIGFTGNPSLAYALGYCYVVEGSTLGGRVILKHVAPALQLDLDGTRFFTGYGAETGKFWKGFLQQFTTYILENNLQNEAILGAIDGFSDIGRHFASHE